MRIFSIVIVHEKKYSSSLQLHLRPSEECPAGVAGDGSVVSASFLRGNVANCAHGCGPGTGPGLARVHHTAIWSLSLNDMVFVIFRNTTYNMTASLLTQ